jgi:hypothetical protein
MASFWNIKVDILNIISNEYAIRTKVVPHVEANNFAFWIISIGDRMKKLEPIYCSSMERKMKECNTTTDTVYMVIPVVIRHGNSHENGPSSIFVSFLPIEAAGGKGHPTQVVRALG